MTLINSFDTVLSHILLIIVFLGKTSANNAPMIETTTSKFRNWVISCRTMILLLTLTICCLLMRIQALHHCLVYRKQPTQLTPTSWRSLWQQVHLKTDIKWVTSRQMQIPLINPDNSTQLQSHVVSTWMINASCMHPATWKELIALRKPKS